MVLVYFVGSCLTGIHGIYMNNVLKKCFNSDSF